MNLVSLVKRIYTLGYEPRVYHELSDRKTAMKNNGGDWTTLTLASTATVKGASYSGFIETYEDTDYNTAISNAGGTHNQKTFLRYVDRKPNYSSRDCLLSGWIGYFTYAEASHPSDLYAKSLTIMNNARTAETLPSRRGFVAIDGITGQGDPVGGRCPSAKWALVAKKLSQRASTLWWYDDTSGSATDYLLASETKGLQSDRNWTVATLDAQTAESPVTYDIGFGAGFANNAEGTWNASIIPSQYAIWIGGASGNGEWAKQVQTDGGHSAIMCPANGKGAWHVTGLAATCTVDAALAVLSGRSLCEAAYLGVEGTYFAIGDPLFRLGT